MDRTNEFSKEDIKNNKGIACFAYFGLLFIMPLFSAGDSPFARFHANQGMVLAMDEIILIIFILIANLLSPIVPSVFPYVRLLLCVILFGGMLFSVIYGVVNTLRGKAKELPIIGKTTVLR